MVVAADSRRSSPSASDQTQNERAKFVFDTRGAQLPPWQLFAIARAHCSRSPRGFRRFDRTKKVQATTTRRKTQLGASNFALGCVSADCARHLPPRARGRAMNGESGGIQMHSERQRAALYTLHNAREHQICDRVRLNFSASCAKSIVWRRRSRARRRRWRQRRRRWRRRKPGDARLVVIAIIAGEDDDAAANANTPPIKVARARFFQCCVAPPPASVAQNAAQPTCGV